MKTSLKLEALVKIAARATAAASQPSRGAYPGSKNNPANMRHYNQGWYGEKTKGLNQGDFLKFDTPHNGLRAASRCLTTLGSRAPGGFTISNVIPRFSPRSENNTENHIANISSISGIGKDQVIDPKNDGQMADLLRGVTGAESGRATQNWFTPQEYTNAVRRARISL